MCLDHWNWGCKFKGGVAGIEKWQFWSFYFGEKYGNVGQRR